MHISAGIPLESYHFGGDEAKNILLGPGYASYSEDLKQYPFEKSPACQAKVTRADDPSFDIKKIANYWAVTVNKILSKHGIKEMVAWEDGLRGTEKREYETESVAINFWEALFWGAIDGLVEIASSGFDIILANPDYLYFDFPYEVHPEERGYYWAARFNSVYKVFSFAPENMAQNAETSFDRDGKEMSVETPSILQPKIRGMQGQTWTETVRTDEQYYEMVFPRMLAVAERAWHRGSWELDWSPGVVFNSTTGLVPKDLLKNDYNHFVSALGCRELMKLEKLGIEHRMPPPGASLDPYGVLTANSEMPCTTIMYSIDGSNTWSEYSGPVWVGTGRVASLRSISSNGVLKSRVVVADEECSDCQEKSNSNKDIDNEEDVITDGNDKDTITGDNGENSNKFASTPADGNADSDLSPALSGENSQLSWNPDTWQTLSSGCANAVSFVGHIVCMFLGGFCLAFM